MIIAIHLGAGYFNTNKIQSNIDVARNACYKSMEALKSGSSALGAVEIAISNMENSPTTNAGYGSYLNNAGQVECDASVMSSHNHLFGSVACAQNSYNPIQLASSIIRFQESSVGIVPPIALSGKGTFDWAVRLNIPTVSNESLMSEQSIERFNMNKYNKERPQDTVGAVCCDINGHMAAGCSTGGPEFRIPGRVSHASVFGAGCWAEECGQLGVAVSTSGMGEQLLVSSLARKNAEFCFRNGFDKFTPHAQTEFINSEFIGSKFTNKCPHKLAGSLVLMKSEKSTKVIWGHTTKSMLISYMHSFNPESMTTLSHLTNKNMEGIGATSNGVFFL